jgi:hypothetical protein
MDEFHTWKRRRILFESLGNDYFNGFERVFEIEF